MSGGADWNTPTSATGYLTVLTNLNDKDVDAITLQKTAPSNLPVGAIAWDRGALKFKEWNGAAFVDMVIDIAGGGTGAATAAGARTNLGLGTMAVQDASAVVITGGIIVGVNMSAGSITSGTLALARGGTGASLALGASGTILQSNGAAVVFGTDGSGLINLNASNLSSGAIPSARITAVDGSAITTGAIPSARITAVDGTAITTGTINANRLPLTNNNQLRSRAHNALAQSIPDTNEVALSFSVVDYDVGGIHSLGTTFTIPADGAGMWLFSAMWTSNPGVNALFRLRLYKNGVNYLTLQDITLTPNGELTLSGTTADRASDGDVYEFFVFQNTGSALNTVALATVGMATKLN